ncbi:glycosyltransferase [Patescibacteria group bacterium]|nr:glycosyltransferase [Patescibacteria group bacterium]
MQKQNNPLVSVLMTAYNAEKYIGLAIESILNQTYKNFEFIIIEDCSTDKTWNIIQRYVKKDKRIIATKNEVNLNAGGSSNKGLKLCKGKYIVRMDADDWSYPDRIEKQVKYMETNNDIVCSGGTLLNCDEQLQPYGVRKYALEHKDIIKQILQFNPVPHPASIWRKDILDKTHGYPPKLGMSEDYALTLEISQYGNLGNIEDELIKYRIHKKSASNAKMSYQQAITVYLSFKGQFEYKFKPKFKDHFWRILQILTMYTIPAPLKRSLFNLMIQKKKK